MSTQELEDASVKAALDGVPESLKDVFDGAGEVGGIIEILWAFKGFAGAPETTKQMVDDVVEVVRVFCTCHMRGKPGAPLAEYYRGPEVASGKLKNLLMFLALGLDIWAAQSDGDDFTADIAWLRARCGEQP